MNIKFGVQNILNTKYRVELGDNGYLPLQQEGLTAINNFYNGITFNATVGYTF